MIFPDNSAALLISSLPNETKPYYLFALINWLVEIKVFRSIIISREIVDANAS